VSVNYKSWPFSSVLWYCWLGHKTCENCRPYNLYCVGADVKLCSINQSINKSWRLDLCYYVHSMYRQGSLYWYYSYTESVRWV